MKRREALRLLAIASVATLGAACQLGPPGPEQQPATPVPTPVPPPPTAIPPDIAALPALRLAIDLDPDTLDPAGQTNPTVSS
ncbi:MAG: hypothetical protein ACR2IK_01535, partial [Chloroflexota bacterium]